MINNKKFKYIYAKNQRKGQIKNPGICNTGVKLKTHEEKRTGYDQKQCKSNSCVFYTKGQNFM